jgi:chromosome segregation ATPase
MTRIPLSRLIAAACALTLNCATAQTPPPAKPAAKPPSIVVPQAKGRAPAKAPSKTLGGKAAPSGKMLTRDELRQCMARLDSINKSGKDLEQQRSALDAERAELTKAGDALKSEREEVDRKLAAVREWESRVRAHGQDIDAFNRRSSGLADLPRDQREVATKELDEERLRLNRSRDAIAADETRLVPVYQDGVKAYNEKAVARDAKVEDWNKRNAALNEVALKQDEARSAWLSECANRPYREEDEIAIKKGQ